MRTSYSSVVSVDVRSVHQGVHREHADELEQRRRIDALRQQAREMVAEIAQLDGLRLVDRGGVSVPNWGQSSRDLGAAGKPRGCCACCGQPPKSDDADVTAAAFRAT